jgi:hypothetical protein
MMIAFLIPAAVSIIGAGGSMLLKVFLGLFCAAVVSRYLNPSAHARALKAVDKVHQQLVGLYEDVAPKLQASFKMWADMFRQSDRPIVPVQPDPNAHKLDITPKFVKDEPIAIQLSAHSGSAVANAAHVVPFIPPSSPAVPTGALIASLMPTVAPVVQVIPSAAPVACIERLKVTNHIDVTMQLKCQQLPQVEAWVQKGQTYTFPPFDSSPAIISMQGYLNGFEPSDSAGRVNLVHHVDIGVAHICIERVNGIIQLCQVAS